MRLSPSGVFGYLYLLCVLGSAGCGRQATAQCLKSDPVSGVNWPQEGEPQVPLACPQGWEIRKQPTRVPWGPRPAFLKC